MTDCGKDFLPPDVEARLVEAANDPNDRSVQWLLGPPSDFVVNTRGYLSWLREKVEVGEWSEQRSSGCFPTTPTRIHPSL